MGLSRDCQIDLNRLQSSARLERNPLWAGCYYADISPASEILVNDVAIQRRSLVDFPARDPEEHRIRVPASAASAIFGIIIVPPDSGEAQFSIRLFRHTAFASLPGQIPL